MVQIAERGTKLPESPIRKLKPFADMAKAKGKSVFQMNIGQPDIETPIEMLNVMKKLEHTVIAYGPSQGLPEYIDALIKYYKKQKIDLNANDIIVTTGGSEAIIMGMTVCMDQGDEVIIPEPFYANYNGFAVATGVKIIPLTTTLESNWEIQIEKMEKLITKKTKAIMICNPNNPTGKLYSKSDLKKIIDIAIKHNLFLFADEVYREFIFNGEKHTSLMDFPEAQNHVIVMDSISKRFSSCGSRIGAFITKNKDVYKAALAYGQARLCPPTIDQLMAIPAVDLPDSYFSKVVGEYKKRRDVVLEGLKKIPGAKFQIPDGAFYIVTELPVDDAEEFIKWMLSDFEINGETLMLAPASGFYNTPNKGTKEVRLAFVLNVDSTKRAMNILEKGVAKYREVKKI